MNKATAANAIESICFQIAKLDGKQQSEFIDSLRNTLNEKEIEALQIGIAYFRMLLDGELRNAMKAAIASKLYQEFNRRINS